MVAPGTLCDVEGDQKNDMIITRNNVLFDVGHNVADCRLLGITGGGGKVTQVKKTSASLERGPVPSCAVAATPLFQIQGLAHKLRMRSRLKGGGAW